MAAGDRTFTVRARSVFASTGDWRLIYTHTVEGNPPTNDLRSETANVFLTLAEVTAELTAGELTTLTTIYGKLDTLIKTKNSDLAAATQV